MDYVNERLLLNPADFTVDQIQVVRSYIFTSLIVHVLWFLWSQGAHNLREVQCFVRERDNKLRYIAQFKTNVVFEFLEYKHGEYDFTWFNTLFEQL